MMRELSLYGFASCDYVLNWALGVEREIFGSSSLMSTGNLQIEAYLSSASQYQAACARGH
jgi:hypothetical protein